jgi:hypothetical protein
MHLAPLPDRDGTQRDWAGNEITLDRELTEMFAGSKVLVVDGGGRILFLATIISIYVGMYGDGAVVESSSGQRFTVREDEIPRMVQAGCTRPK